jgi:small subunit ribosomal protein S19e
MGIYDVDQSELVKRTAEELKGFIKKPDWSNFAKTGSHKERPPVDKDWWYIRAASVLKNIAYKGPIGVSKLRTKYGGRKNRGYKPEKFVRGSGSIARKILQQLEKVGLIKQEKRGVHKGRVITKKGQELLFNVAQSISPDAGKQKPINTHTVKEKKEKKEKEIKEEKPVDN